MYKKFVLIIAVVFMASCKTTEIEVLKTPSKYGEIDVIAVETSHPTKVILLVPDDDTLSVREQVRFFKPLLDKETSLYAFPKYAYNNPILKDNADNPTLRLELLVKAYQNLVAQNKIDSSVQLVVLGVGEGNLIAPHFSKLVHANELILINPYFHSLKENMTLAFTEPTKNSAQLKQVLGFARDQKWLQFLTDVTEHKSPDKSAGSRTYRYYINYWEYYPGDFYYRSSTPVKLLIFKDYIYSSQLDKDYLMGLKNPNITSKVLEGSFYSKFSYTELKKLGWL